VLRDLESISLASPLPSEDHVLLTKEQGRCLEIRGAIRRNLIEGVSLEITLSNTSMVPMDSFAFKMNSNIFGLQAPPTFPLSILPQGKSASLKLPLQYSQSIAVAQLPEAAHSAPFHFQFAIRTNAGVCYFFAPVSPEQLLVDSTLADYEIDLLLSGRYGAQTGDETVAVNSSSRFLQRLVACKFRPIKLDKYAAPNVRIPSFFYRFSSVNLFQLNPLLFFTWSVGLHFNRKICKRLQSCVQAGFH
jgi:hypothetical protein